MSSGARVVIYSGLGLSQRVFSQIDYLSERIVELAYRDSHFKNLTNEVGI